MKKCHLSTSTTILISVLSFAAVADDTLYGQYPKDYNDLQSLTRFLSGEPSDTVAGQTNDQIVADNFILQASDASITGVSWWGSSDNVDTLALDNFMSITVKILSKINEPVNSKQNIVYQETFLLADTNPLWVGFGAAVPGGLIYYQNISFQQPVEVCKGTEYWISISATNQSPPLDGNGYFWNGADTLVDDTMWIATFSDVLDPPYTVNWFEFFGDQAFELKGTNTTLGAVKCPTPTPIPTSTPTSTPTFTPTSTPISTPTHRRKDAREACVTWQEPKTRGHKKQIFSDCKKAYTSSHGKPITGDKHHRLVFPQGAGERQDEKGEIKGRSEAPATPRAPR